MLSVSQSLVAHPTAPEKSDSVINLSTDDFARQVLRLVQGQSEDDYQQSLLAQAKEVGLYLPASAVAPNERSESHAPVALPSRTSISSDSQMSSMSSLTFDLSRRSGSHHDKHRALTHERRGSETSSLTRDYDSVLGYTRAKGRRSFNLSPPLTPALSTASLPLSPSTQASPRKQLIKGLSRLRLRRAESKSSLQSDCLHCLNDTSKPRRAVHRLPCGHVYCALALRKLIETVIDLDTTHPPSCCNQPIPGHLVDTVMSQEEQAELVGKMLAWEDTASSASSVSAKGERSASEVSSKTAGLNRRHRTLAGESSVLAMQEAHMVLGKALETPDFQVVLAEQKDQCDRFIRWDQGQQQRLAGALKERQAAITADFVNQDEELADRHLETIADVEDKHVMAEDNLRTTQETEKRNTAIALRHMEAYCRGDSINGKPHGRAITEQDRRELDRTRLARDRMDSKHNNAINVLRGEQDQRMRARLQRQAGERKALEQKRDGELEAARTVHRSKLRDWDEEVGRKRAKLESLWGLQTEIWKKKLELETGVSFDGPLPPLAWPDEDGRRTNKDIQEMDGSALDGLPKTGGTH